MSENTLYTYSPKGDHLTLFKGKKKVHTPNGNVVIANTEQLAERIVAELSSDADYTSCASVLCYHYTYCDLIAQYDTATIADDLQTCCRENIAEDPLLYFRADEESEDLETEALRKMSQLVNKCNINQLVSIIVIYCSFESLLLSYHIIDMLNQGTGKEKLIADLRDYFKELEVPCPKNIDGIIDSFAYYYGN